MSAYMNFGQIYGEVVNRLGNRTDITTRVKQWVNQAIFSIATSYKFYELEVSATGTTVSETKAYTNPSDLRILLDLSCSKEQVWSANTTYSSILIIPTTFNGHKYTGTGVSGSTEPTWPTGIGETVTDGTITWVESGLEGVTKLTQADWRVLDKSNTTNSNPNRYVRYGNSIELNPIPNGKYRLSIRYLKRVASLVNDSDEPVLPDEWIEAIILRACWIGAMSLQMFDSEKAFKEEYALYVMERKPDYKESSFDMEFGISNR